MALTLAINHSYVLGDRIEVIADVTADASYPTGGYSLTPTQLGLITELDVVSPINGLAGNTFAYDYTNQKLKVFAVGGAEVANTTDIHTVTTKIIAKGKGFAPSAV